MTFRVVIHLLFYECFGSMGHCWVILILYAWVIFITSLLCFCYTFEGAFRLSVERGGVVCRRDCTLTNCSTLASFKVSYLMLYNCFWRPHGNFTGLPTRWGWRHVGKRSRRSQVSYALSPIAHHHHHRKNWFCTLAWPECTLRKRVWTRAAATRLCIASR